MVDVVVLGSVNMDLVARVERLPKPGETLMGSEFATVPGGKGANQTVAVARLGVETAMVGRVGDDGFGKGLRDRLQSEDIDTTALSISKTAPSGTALIALALDNNQIIVVSGANGDVSESDLDRLTPYFEQAKVLLLQFEIPLATVQKAAALAAKAGLVVIVDPAPVPASGDVLTPDFCKHISILTPNQTEAALLTEMDVVDVDGAIAAAETLQGKGIEVVIIKMGELGCVCANEKGSFSVPAFPVIVTDTVAAGDAFNGGLAASLCRMGLSRADMATRLSDQDFIRPIINYASAVAALAVTQPGAQSSMPTAIEVETFLKSQP